ncbi:MAG: hypothetical protein HN742_37270 [Lentisphaerae bacterium]|jgi:hypothetical protein|nr:hypothetical protein [Lentisphaerota bacterium]MBT7060317.1 hypothetical protein [Lentisphaerota bacterium]MBT7847579.1 hypothetical protein [Lentisphaerota bacterium]
MNLLSHTKPKASCPSLSLPAVVDCPACELSVRMAKAAGKSPICERCYAQKGRYVFPKVRENQRLRSQWWHDTAPVDRAVILADAIKREGLLRYFRCYDSGDLDLSAIETWLVFADLLPDIKIWIPTRTWVLPEFMPGLRALNAHPRIVVRPSAVAFDDPPEEIPGLSGGHSAHWREPIKAGYRCPGNCATCRTCWDEPELSVGFERR